MAATAAQSMVLRRSWVSEQSSHPEKQPAAEEKAKEGTARRSHCCVGQAFQQHNPAAKGNLLWQLGPTASGKLKRGFGVFFYLFSGVDQSKLSWLKISFVLDSREILLTTCGLILLFICFIITYFANRPIYCDESLILWSQSMKCQENMPLWFPSCFYCENTLVWLHISILLSLYLWKLLVSPPLLSCLLCP